MSSALGSSREEAGISPKALLAAKAVRVVDDPKERGAEDRSKPGDRPQIVLGMNLRIEPFDLGIQLIDEFAVEAQPFDFLPHLKLEATMFRLISSYSMSGGCFNSGNFNASIK